MKNKIIILVCIVMTVLIIPRIIFGIGSSDSIHLSKRQKATQLEELGYTKVDKNNYTYTTGSHDDYALEGIIFDYQIVDNYKEMSSDIVTLKTENHTYSTDLRKLTFNIDGVGCYNFQLDPIPEEKSNPTCVAIDADDLTLNTFNSEVKYLLLFDSKYIKEIGRGDGMPDDFETLSINDKETRLLSLGYQKGSNDNEYVYVTGTNDTYGYNDIVIHYNINDDKRLASTDKIYLEDGLNHKITYDNNNQTIAIDDAVCFSNVDEIKSTMINTSECLNKDVDTSYVEVLMSEQKYIFGNEIYSYNQRKLFKMESYGN